MSIDAGSVANLLSAVEQSNEQAAQICRDRADLLDALVKLRGYVDRLVAPIAAEEPQAAALVADDLRQVDALIARVKESE